jgi:uncharacterized protein YndB with AHSA1/START domain
MKIQETFEVAVPADRVFEYLADPRHVVGVDPDLIVAVEQLDDGGRGGAPSYRISGPKLRGPWLTEYTELNRPHRIRAEFAQESGRLKGWTTYELEPRAGSTFIHMKGDAHLGALLEGAVMLLSPIVRWQVRRGNRRLAKSIERWAVSRDIHQR